MANTKTTKKAAEAKAETKPVEAAAPAAEKAVEAPKKRAAAKKEAAPKRAAAKKEAAPKKTAAKRAANKDAKADTVVSIYIQQNGNEVSTAALTEKAKSDAGIKSAESIDIYVRPEINMVYYVIDGEKFGNFELC